MPQRSSKHGLLQSKETTTFVQMIEMAVEEKMSGEFPISKRYKIEMYRNFDGEFYYFIMVAGKRIAISQFYTTKDWCEKSAKRIARSLKCKIIYIDLRYDYEE